MLNGDISTVPLKNLIEKMNLENLTPDVDIDKIELTMPDINRPALQLAGFMKDFDRNRIQIIGNVEHSYLKAQEDGIDRMKSFLKTGIPCVVFC
ncbi:MAG: HPr(Ser) kinase/phosphatase, partial [Lachnospiraceae bacterium]|nr:HPr(Ser) kinase/phosphatase [Lachnospiraceae bacterium]